MVKNVAPKDIKSKHIDIRTQEGLDLLKAYATYTGYQADFLKVHELIAEVEKLRAELANRVSAV